jgi:hypothetical protein
MTSVGGQIIITRKEEQCVAKDAVDTLYNEGIGPALRQARFKRSGELPSTDAEKSRSVLPPTEHVRELRDRTPPYHRRPEARRGGISSHGSGLAKK